MHLMSRLSRNDRSKRQVVYRYNGDATSEDVVDDTDDNMPVCHTGDVIIRHGRRWKVRAVTSEDISDGLRAITITRLFLTDTLR